jgi:ABC-type lipoprotein release transport system permease subunit
MFLSKEGAESFRNDVVPALPPALVQHWPYVVLVVYLVDVLLLVSIGKVPLAYNARNLIVRWRITLLTALAFTVVVGLLTVLLAFVNGMDQLTENSGIPGNVFILSDGSTDEVFSNLGFGDVDNVERETVTLDPKDRPLPETVGVKRVRLGEREVSLFSKETYCVVNQAVPNPSPGRPPRRFVQVRGVEDAEISAAVHNVGLLPGGKWFDPTSGVRPPPDGKGSSWIEAVIGEGVAGTLGSDKGKARLGVGDTFEMGERTWVVTGVLHAEGSTFGSEVWAKQQQVGELFRKKNFTTVALRVSDESAAGAKAMAYHLRNNYTVQKLKAQTEMEYYSELGKTNKGILVIVIVVAVVMAIGGVFGVMNTMFAAIAQRTKDIGVLRLLGFKRWQVLVSFMLESFGIALIGGLLGCLIGGLLADGRTAQSIVSSGQGSGKTVILRMTVNTDIVMAGVLFTLVMGRLGGLVPALSAMRLKILESLR